MATSAERRPPVTSLRQKSPVEKTRGALPVAIGAGLRHQYHELEGGACATILAMQYFGSLFNERFGELPGLKDVANPIRFLRGAGR